jgi:hypothetical protein
MGVHGSSGSGSGWVNESGSQGKKNISDFAYLFSIEHRK